MKIISPGSVSSLRMLEIWGKQIEIPKQIKIFDCYVKNIRFIQKNQSKIISLYLN